MIHLSVLHHTSCSFMFGRNVYSVLRLNQSGDCTSKDRLVCTCAVLRDIQSKPKCLLLYVLERGQHCRAFQNFTNDVFGLEMFGLPTFKLVFERVLNQIFVIIFRPDFQDVPARFHALGKTCSNTVWTSRHLLAGRSIADALPLECSW